MKNKKYGISRKVHLGSEESRAQRERVRDSDGEKNARMDLPIRRPIRSGIDKKKFDGMSR